MKPVGDPRGTVNYPIGTSISICTTFKPTYWYLTTCIYYLELPRAF